MCLEVGRCGHMGMLLFCIMSMLLQLSYYVCRNYMYTYAYPYIYIYTVCNIVQNVVSIVQLVHYSIQFVIIFTVTINQVKPLQLMCSVSQSKADVGRDESKEGMRSDVRGNKRVNKQVE